MGARACSACSIEGCGGLEWSLWGVALFDLLPPSICRMRWKPSWSASVEFGFGEGDLTSGCGSGSFARVSGGGLNNPAKRDDFPGLPAGFSLVGESKGLGLSIARAGFLSPRSPKNRSIVASVWRGVPPWLNISPSVGLLSGFDAVPVAFSIGGSFLSSP